MKRQSLFQLEDDRRSYLKQPTVTFTSVQSGQVITLLLEGHILIYWAVLFPSRHNLSVTGVFNLTHFPTYSVPFFQKGLMNLHSQMECKSVPVSS